MKGSDLKIAIINGGYTISSIAREMGVSQQRLDAALKSDDVKSSLVEGVARVLKMSLASLYGEQGHTATASGSGNTAVAGVGNTLSHDEGLVELLKSKDEQINRLLTLLEAQQ